MDTPAIASIVAISILILFAAYCTWMLNSRLNEFAININSRLHNIEKKQEQYRREAHIRETLLVRHAALDENKLNAQAGFVILAHELLPEVDLNILINAARVIRSDVEKGAAIE